MGEVNYTVSSTFSPRAWRLSGALDPRFEFPDIVSTSVEVIL